MSRRRRRWFWLLAACGLLATGYLARERVLPLAASWLDVGTPPQSGEYVLALGGDLEIRPFVAAALVKRGLARKVLIPQVAAAPEVADGILPPQHDLATRILVWRGVPRENVVLLGQDNASTYDEARSLAQFLESAQEAHVIVVTNGYHTRRARWVFSQVLGTRMAQVTFFSAPSERFEMATWWRTEEGFSTITGENVKFVLYVFRYSRAAYVVVAAVVLTLAMAFWLRRRRNKCYGAESSAQAVA